ncbi:hypothetical protein EYF80_051578 [Liparis tanakae]|uniref:Uncharacterized protein n=1 Tax=Liparis tanakae TaxID=230148 RepID=A0A4Z2FBE8_9TELE|nr:hypothetical protein EYF80_051578 [Liparis tanakae]
MATLLPQPFANTLSFMCKMKPGGPILKTTQMMKCCSLSVGAFLRFGLATTEQTKEDLCTRYNGGLWEMMGEES